MATVALQSTVSQGTSGLFILDGTVLDDSQLATVDAGLFYVDTDTGQVYTREAIDGDSDDDGVWQAQGKLLPFVGDQTAPGQVTGLTVTPVTSQAEDGTTIPAFSVTWTRSTEADLIGYSLQLQQLVWDATADGGNGDWTPTTWGSPIVVAVSVTDEGTAPTTLVKTGLIPGGRYSFRVRALDAEGFAGTWSATVDETATPDSEAPEVPEDVSVNAGFKLLGIHWGAVAETPDFAHYEVRFYVTTEGVDEATTIQTRTNRLIIKDLTASTEYTLQVRALDLSGNASAWSTTVTGTPVLVGASDLAFDSLITNFLSTGELSADLITSGTLQVGGTGAPGSIEVYSGVTLLAKLNEDGLVMVNPANSSQAMWLHSGKLQFSAAYDGSTDTTVWTTAVTPSGINAEAITFGTFGGGANSIPNAGFELAPFTAPTEDTYPTSPWGTDSSAVNSTTSSGTISMTAS